MAKKHIHERRNVTFGELLALLGVRAALQRGDLTADPAAKVSTFSDIMPGCHLFNMGTTGMMAHCGTVGCIGANMALVLGLDMFAYVGSRDDGKRSPSLAVLFYPPDNVNWNKISPRIAVKAIDNWLKDGKPRWNKLLSTY